MDETDPTKIRIPLGDVDRLLPAAAKRFGVPEDEVVAWMLFQYVAEENAKR